VKWAKAKRILPNFGLPSSCGDKLKGRIERIGEMTLNVEAEQ